ncbi:GNAT family N-acetyltransferase [Agreia sp.]|uniref:GNAT family N-acetyltransferase n=1 Tax=Agreia sp. TaxID=1872416 RepID=UPI0035BC835E
MSSPAPVDSSGVAELREFLAECDLTTSGLDAPGTRYWISRDERGRVVGSTGFELSPTTCDALIRSVAVASDARAAGLGTELALFAITAARDAGAQRAWLFSRRSGPFWQRLGFERVPTESLAEALAESPQVALFRATGQLARGVAWARTLS